MSIGGSRFAQTTSPRDGDRGVELGKVQHEIDEGSDLFDAGRLDAHAAQRDVLDAVEEEDLVPGVVDVRVHLERGNSRGCSEVSAIGGGYRYRAWGVEVKGQQARGVAKLAQLMRAGETNRQAG